MSVNIKRAAGSIITSHSSRNNEEIHYPRFARCWTKLDKDWKWVKHHYIPLEHSVYELSNRLTINTQELYKMMQWEAAESLYKWKKRKGSKLRKIRPIRASSKSKRT